MARDPFSSDHTPEQRAACAAAFLDGLRPAQAVADAAQAGALGLPAFAVPDSRLVRTWADRELKRRGRERVELMRETPPADAVELLRQELVAVTWDTLQRLKRTPAEERDPERIRQLARAIRELAQVPGPGDAPTRKPGSSTTGEPNREGATRGGVAGGPLAAAALDGATAHDVHGDREALAPSSSAQGEEGDDARAHDVATPALT